MERSSLFDEKAADEEVIRSLHKEISKLQGELHMSKIIKSFDGKYYIGEFEEIPAEQVTAIIAEKQAQLQQLEAIAPAYNSPAPAAAPASADDANEDKQEQPANAAADTSNAQDAPSEPTQSPPAAPTEGQVVDPNAAPPAAPADPNVAVPDAPVQAPILQ